MHMSVETGLIQESYTAQQIEPCRIGPEQAEMML
jgi:hypothetical protein